jgi:2-amino-4-hydroxy-6-hydroxymethyldihydropteridine diphosphokinase
VAWEKLAPWTRQRRLSSIYESQPLYVTDQPLFLNAVGEAWSPLSPRRMLDVLHEIERELGRDRARERRMGPRTVDLDILLCDGMIVDTTDLSIPHPRMLERAFVLVPLLELDPGLCDPRTGTAYSRVLEELDARARASAARDPSGGSAVGMPPGAAAEMPPGAAAEMPPGAAAGVYLYTGG